MVNIVGAPGYEDFEAELILSTRRMDGVPLCIVGDPETKEIFVIQSRYVFVK